MLTKSRPNSNRYRARIQDLPTPTHLRCEGHRTRSHPILQAIQVNQAIPPEHTSSRRKGIPPIEGRAQEARWSLRMHSLRLLLDILSIILVELGRILGTSSLDAELQMDCGFSRLEEGRAKGGFG